MPRCGTPPCPCSRVLARRVRLRRCVFVPSLLPAESSPVTVQLLPSLSSKSAPATSSLRSASEDRLTAHHGPDHKASAHAEVLGQRQPAASTGDARHVASPPPWPSFATSRASNLRHRARWTGLQRCVFPRIGSDLSAGEVGGFATSPATILVMPLGLVMPCQVQLRRATVGVTDSVDVVRTPCWL